MKILKIELENFMCYSGTRNVIQFTEGLNLILGGNGYGKTKLYDAFNWVLFDKITDQDGRLTLSTQSIKEGLISKRALAEVEDNKEVTAVVRLEVVNDKSKHIILERSYKTMKLSGMEFSGLGKSTLVISEKDEFEYKPLALDGLTGIDEYIREQIIPLDILEYLWFQGERGIKRAVDTSSTTKLQQVINKLSYIDTWERFISAAIDTDRRTKDKFDKAVRRSDKNQEKSNKLQSDLQSIQDKLAKVEKELGINKREIERADEQIDNLSMSEGVRDDLRNLSDEENKLKRELTETEREYNDILDKANRDLFEDFWVIHGTEHMAKKFEGLREDYIYSRHEDRKRAENGLPPIPKGHPTAAHLNKMLKDEHCNICNRPAEKGSEAYEHIKKLLPENYPRVEDNFDPYHHEGSLQNLSSSKYRVTHHSEDFEAASAKVTQRYFMLKDKWKKLEEESRKTEEQKAILLSRYGLESVESGMRQGEQYMLLGEKKAKLSKEIGRLEVQKEELSEEQKKKNKDLENLLGDEMDPILSKQMKYFESLLSAAKEAKEAQYNKLVDLLSRETNQHYEAINKHSGAFFGKVVFRQNSKGGYFPEIQNENGESVTSGMSTSQLLSMQFSILFAILSANKEYGYNKRYPLIADAPNSAFDAKKKKHLLRQIGTTFEQSIVMMFEYLENDPDRANRYKVDEGGLSELVDTMRKEGVNVNIIMLDVPDGINSRDINELTVQIKNL
ncbi:AAA family ATPase [Lewinella sp. LCG006]|uniref:AAA family ATPase n=1 Tax=Lewinella sp. LCG006 TaxID=3231911 RepID=UPI00345F47FF